MESYQQFIERKGRQFARGRLISTKDVGRKARHYWEREAWSFMPQYNLKQKVFVIERLRRIKVEGTSAHPKTAKAGDIEYRIGYYIIGKNGRAKGKWTWGQFCPLIPGPDLPKLLAKARKEGTVK